MLEMLKFLEGKKEFLEKDDLKEFFKDRYLNVEKFIHTNKNACEPVLYKYIFEPVYGLDDKMVEQVYVVKKVNEYNDNGQFLCIIDKLNKVLILNESVFIDNLAIYLKYLNITKEEKELLQEFMYANMEIMSNEKAGLFKETFLRDNIGQYKVLSAVSIHNELNNSLYKYIYDNIESFAEKMGIKDDCIEEVVNTSKDFFVGKRNYEKDVFMDVYRPKYSQIINDCQNRYKNTASYLYNYALNKASAMEKYANFINDKVNNADCVYSVNKYFNVKNIYVLKNAKKIFR